MNTNEIAKRYLQQRGFFGDPMSKSRIESLMSDFAQQLSIEFAEWILIHEKVSFYSIDQWFYKPLQKEVYTQELWELFISEREGK